jgi:hypothetical protein
MTITSDRYLYRLKYRDICKKIPFKNFTMNTLFYHVFSKYSLLIVTLLSFFAGSSQTYNMATGTVTTCSGNFYDNGGAAGNFTNGQNITETFISGNGDRLKFDFTSMSNLNAASLTIYDGPTAAYPVIAIPATGTFSIESTGSSLTFQFYSPSGSFTTYAGWEANITCTTPTLTPYTMSAGTATACSGVFFDPAGPAANYVNSNITTQTFSSGSSDFINFTFTNFDVAIGDTLFAYDGTNVSAPLIGKYTGIRLPEVISSRTGSSMTFRFATNNTTVASGWKAMIACSVSPVVPTVFNMQDGVRSVCSGTFYDNGGASGNFTNGQNIIETFTSISGSRLKFDFTSMSSLNAASLTIYDGPTAAYPVISTPASGTFSVESTGSSLTFQFYSQSGSFTTYAGWEANISCTTPTLTPYTMSAGTVTTCSGVFFDPAGPATNYANSNITTQTFSSGSANFINFTFTNFDVAIGDTLFAYDGTNVSAPLIGKYTGIRLPEVISSRTGSDVTFRFITNNTTVSSGWKAVIACSASPVVPTVFNMQDGVRSVCSGTFYDNGGASGNFTNGQNIIETFVSLTGSRLKFDFTSMSNLNAASLTIYDGPTAAYPVIQRPATGTFSVESTGSSLTFQFYSQSGSFTTYAGWEANITCTTPTLTPYIMSTGSVTTCSGVFFDPAGPATNYANSNITTQTFSSGSANFINFTFTNFDVAIGDTLFAYDGTNVSAALIGKYTGNRSPEIISSRTGSSVTFRFASNNATNDLGWQAIIGCSPSAIIPSVFNMQNGVRSVCSGTFYDNGGAAGNFTNGQNITETFVSSTGSKLKFDFTSMSNLNAASLTIYDGPTAAYPVIQKPATGTFSVESTGSSLTFQFYSQSGSFTTYAGWEANITCTTPTLTPYTMSTGSVTTCSGVFFDPAGPATNYANSNITTQTFSSGSANFINFSFTNFDVALGDTLFAYDGTSVSAPLIGKYTGSRLPEIISSRTGSSVTFRFASNNATNDLGWQAIIGCSATAIIPTAYNMQDGVRSVCSGTFYDNGGAANNYILSNHTETFVSSTGSKLKFDFTAMSNLNSASVKVYDGPTTSSPLIGTYAGSTFSVQSTGSYLTFYFNGTSSGTSTYAGWEANISCVTTAAIPVASFSTTTYTICSGSCINYTDLTTNGPTAWNWQFQGAAISSSTVQNPTGVCYNTAGTYTVSLTASNGSGSSVATQTITVLARPTVSISPLTASICQGQSVTLTASGATTYTWSTGSTSNSITVSPFSSSSYTVTSSTGNGCPTSVTRLVTVRTVPVIFIGGGTVACPGQSVTLTASGASTYTWSTGATSNSITVSPSLPTTYTVTGQGSNGCTGDATQTVTIGSPASVSIAGAGTVCAGQPLVLNASGATSYTWSTGSTSTSITVSPTTTTTYTLTGNSGGCNGSAVKTVSVNPSLSISGNTLICTGQSTTLTATGANTYTWSTTATGNSIVVSPATTSTYTVTGESNGCTASAVRIVSVGIASPLNISNPNPTVCAGKSTTLTASGANTYTWSTAASGSSITVSPVSTTTYSVSGSNAAGCISTASTTVSVNAVPVLSVSSSNTLICTGQSVTLNATGANTYSWSTSGTGSSITVSPVANTVYTVTGTGSNGCSSQLSYTQQVSPCTGIEAISGTSADQVYPNPFSNQLKLELGQAALISITNMLGQTLYSGQAESGLTSIDTRDMPAGVYYVEIRNEKRTVIKVIKH